MTSAWRPVSSTFSGLMSRWTTPRAVGVGERLGDVAEEPHRVGDRQLAAPGQPVAERLALDVRHDVVEEAVGLARVEQRQDVGVLQAGGDLDLADEPLRAQRGRELGAEHLDRDLAVGA